MQLERILISACCNKSVIRLSTDLLHPMFFFSIFDTSFFPNTGYQSSFTERHRVSAPKTSFFTLSAAGHWGWALCIGSLVARRSYEMRLIFDDESVEYIRNCSFYVEPVDNCTQTKYVPFRKEPKKIMNKTTGKSKERLKMSDLTCLPSCKV